MKNSGGWLALFLCSALLGCQSTPTRVSETHDVDITALVYGAKRPLNITKDTVVLDTRSAFEFALAHVPGSINLHWEEFAQSRGPYPGLLKDSLDRQARRLATYGISPQTPVIVVGQGIRGQGEEGRLAWTLFYMGVENIQFSDVQYFGQKLTNIQTPPKRENAPFWETEDVESVRAERDEVLASVTAKEDPGQPKIHLIDVRSKKEYFRKKGFGEGYSEPDLQAINIGWVEFLDPLGRPNLDMRAKLKGIGIGENDRIICLSNNGVRSAAVTMALLALGFQKASNFDSGLKALLRR